MKLINNIKYVILLLIIIISVSSVSATITYLGNISGYSISEDTNNNKIFIECIGETGCNEILTDGTTYAKYNLNTNTFSRYDSALVGAIVPTYDGAYSGSYTPDFREITRNVKKYYKDTSGNEFLLVNHNYSITLYKYDTTYNYWKYYSTWTGQYSNAMFQGCNFNTQANNELCYSTFMDGTNAYTIGSYSTINSTLGFETITSFTTTKGNTADSTTATLNGQLFKTTNPQTTTQYLSYNYSFDTSLTATNIIDTSNVDIKKGWVNNDNTIYIATSGENIIVGIIDNNYELDSFDITTTVPSCAIAKTHYDTLLDMTCYNETECIFIGYNSTNDGYIMSFDGSDCYEYDLNQVAGYTPNNKKLYNVEYMNNKFYIVGNQTFLSVDLLSTSSTDSDSLNYTIQPSSDNFIIMRGRIAITDDNKYNYITGDVIYTYPEILNTPATMTYDIESQYNGYYAKICNANIYDNTIYEEYFDDVTKATEAGFKPSPSPFDFYTKEYISAFNKSLALYNETYDIFKTKLVTTDTSIYSQIIFSYDYYPKENSTTIISLIGNSLQASELLNIVMERNTTNLCYYTIDEANQYTSNRELLYCIPFDTQLYFTKIYLRQAYQKTQIITMYNSTIYDSGEIDSRPAGYAFESYRIGSASRHAQPTEDGTFIDNIVVIDSSDTTTSLEYIETPYTLSCNYETNGQCYNTRVYFSLSNNDYLNYRTFRVCTINQTIIDDIITGGDVTETTTNNSTGLFESVFPNNLSPSEELQRVIITMILTAIIIFGIFTYFGVRFNMYPLILIGGVLAIMIDVGWLFYFVSIGYIGIVPIVLMFVIAGLIVATIIAKPFREGTTGAG